MAMMRIMTAMTALVWFKSVPIVFDASPTKIKRLDRICSLVNEKQTKEKSTIRLSGFQPPWAGHYPFLFPSSCRQGAGAWHAALNRKSGLPAWCFQESWRPRRARRGKPDKERDGEDRGRSARAVAQRQQRGPRGHR